MGIVIVSFGVGAAFYASQTDEELDTRIYQYGELSKIFGAAKRRFLSTL